MAGSHVARWAETRSAALAVALALAGTLRRRLQLLQVRVEAVEALVPVSAIALEPIVDLAQRAGLEAAGPPLRFAAAHDQPRALEHLEVLRDGGEAHREGLGEGRHRGLAERKPRQQRATRRVGERRKRGAEVIGRHPLLNCLVD